MKFLLPSRKASAIAASLTVLALTGLASAQSRSFGLTTAMNQTIVIKSCQYDQTMIEGLSPVKFESLTLPDALQASHVDNRTILMTTQANGKIPVTVFYEDGTFARFVVESCKTSGANNLIRIVDDRPALKGASEYTVNTVTQAQSPLTNAQNSGTTLNSKQNLTGGVLSLPTPAGVTMRGVLSDAGLILTIRNASTQTLSLDTSKLKLTSDRDTVATGKAVTTLAPNMQTSVTIPLTAGERAGQLAAVWTVDAPSLSAVFPLTASFQ